MSAHGTTARRFLCFLLISAVPAVAQYSKPTCTGGKNTTTISGVVYSPNGQDPLPDVLVYVPGSAGAVVIPDGITTTDLRPVSPLTETTTAYDGSYTLSDAPAGTAVPIVIQSGKWQRQMVISTVTGCQDNVPPDPPSDKFARFPRNKSEGYIPRIGIVTGSRESTECVLRKVGMDDTEFTNFADNGRINFYVGGGNGGSKINSSTPSEASLMADQAQLNALDLVLFPCQGTDQPTTTAGMANLVSYANGGGRLFVNHHSHAWLKSNSGFANTFNWGSDGASAANGTATVDQTFTIGATLSLWLQNLGQTTTQGKVSLTNVFASLSSLTSNAQRWIQLDSNSLPVQASFNTPVGSSASTAYGRVLYNEYHVSPASSGGTTFPSECTTTTMSQQEKVLEFSLFDLSSFSAIVKVDPDMTLAGSPNPSKLNTPVVMTATLGVPSGSTYSMPTGAVTFSEGTTTYGTVVLKAGVASTTLSGLTAGTHTITAVYTGDPYYFAHTVTTTITVYPAAVVSVVANPNPVYTGHASAITFTASGLSSAVPTGSVALTVDGVTTSYPLTNGQAQAAGKIYANGPHAITAVYSGDANYDSQTATTTLYVQVASSTSLTEAASTIFVQNPAIFTAIVNGTGDVAPGGTMIFTEGSTTIGTAAVSGGKAVLSLSTLAVGPHTVIATYSGDDYYGPSVSTSVVENVMDFSLTVTAAASTIPHSTSAMFTFIVTPVGGTTMPADISFSVAGMRDGSTATFSPTKIATGSGTTSVTLTVQTGVGPSYPPDLIKMSSLGVKGVVFAVLLVPCFARSRRRLQKVCLMVLMAGLLSVGLSGCGTGWKTISYRLTLNTTSGALTHSNDLTLTEQGGK